MIRTTLIAVLALLAAFLIFAATRPNSFRIERAIEIKAPADKIFVLINDLHRWTAWSPWEKVDPALKRAYGGLPSGVGASYAWEGNREVGAGRMEITESVPSSKILIKLDFLKPFAAHNIAEFGLAGAGDSTRVTWAMYGPSPFMAKVMGLVFNMDKMLGGQFDEGLSNLKVLAEK
ncbi:MAG: SRPBCC family protein [Betaproteobacteria bacterium]